MSRARNLGIRQARGDWLAFLDSDDRWLPHKLERQLEALQAHPGMRLVHGDELWTRNGRRVNPMNKHAKSGGHIFQKCLPLCVISPSATMIHRTVFDEIGLFDETLPACEDYDLWLRICARMAVLYIDQPIIEKVGGHADQLSRKYWGMDRFRIVALEKILAAGCLNAADIKAARCAVIEKITVYLNGARKRDKREEVADYERRLCSHEAARANCDVYDQSYCRLT